MGELVTKVKERVDLRAAHAVGRVLWVRVRVRVRARVRVRVRVRRTLPPHPNPYQVGWGEPGEGVQPAWHFGPEHAVAARRKQASK